MYNDAYRNVWLSANQRVQYLILQTLVTVSRSSSDRKATAVHTAPRSPLLHPHAHTVAATEVEVAPRQRAVIVAMRRGRGRGDSRRGRGGRVALSGAARSGGGVYGGGGELMHQT